MARNRKLSAQPGPNVEKLIREIARLRERAGDLHEQTETLIQELRETIKKRDRILYCVPATFLPLPWRLLR